MPGPWLYKTVEWKGLIGSKVTTNYFLCPWEANPHCEQPKNFIMSELIGNPDKKEFKCNYATQCPGLKEALSLQNIKGSCQYKNQRLPVCKGNIQKCKIVCNSK